MLSGYLIPQRKDWVKSCCRSLLSACVSSKNGSNASIFNYRSCLTHLRFYTASSRKCEKLPTQYLDAYDPKKFDPSTHQNNVSFNPIDGAPPTADSHLATTTQQFTNNNDDAIYKHEESWLNAHLQRWRADPIDFDSHWPLPTNELQNKQNKSSTKRILWSNWTEELVRDKEESPILFQYDDIFRNKDKNIEARILRTLYQYGVVLVTGTPSATDSLPKEVMTEATKNVTKSQHRAEDAILHLASIIGYHPLQTLYGGGVWSTSSYSTFYTTDGSNQVKAGSTADSAYGSTSLPLHTDMTYMSNPPGVQIFLMVQPATANRPTGIDQDLKTFSPKGQSIYLDGFSAAEKLRKENPDAFHLLASTQRRYRCIDEAQGWHLEACGPVIELENGLGHVTSIRHNDLDRLPDLPPYNYNKIDDPNYTSFYEKLRSAHEAWDNILRRDEMRLVIDLKCGDTVLVSNQRCLHGRYAFDASSFPRVVLGCYVGMDELCSKWRHVGALF